MLCPIVSKTVLEICYFLNLINENKVGPCGIDSGINIIIQIRVSLYFLPSFLFLVYEDHII